MLPVLSFPIARLLHPSQPAAVVELNPGIRREGGHFETLLILSFLLEPLGQKLASCGHSVNAQLFRALIHFRPLSAYAIELYSGHRSDYRTGFIDHKDHQNISFSLWLNLRRSLKLLVIAALC